MGKLCDDRHFQSTVALEEKKTPAVSPGDTPAGGKRATPAYAEVRKFIRQTYPFVNADSVSKVVDENGEPLVVWHAGSMKDTYDATKADMDALYGPAFYAADSPGRARGFGKTQANAFFIKAVNPFDMDGRVTRRKADAFAAFLDLPNDTFDSLFQDEATSGTPVIGEDVWGVLEDATTPLMANEALVASGYDAAYYTGNSKKSRDWMVFESNQIKSAAANDGSYSPDSDSIL